MDDLIKCRSKASQKQWHNVVLASRRQSRSQAVADGSKLPSWTRVRAAKSADAAVAGQVVRFTFTHHDNEQAITSLFGVNKEPLWVLADHGLISFIIDIVNHDSEHKRLVIKAFRKRKLAIAADEKLAQRAAEDAAAGVSDDDSAHAAAGVADDDSA